MREQVQKEENQIEVIVTARKDMDDTNLDKGGKGRNGFKGSDFDLFWRESQLVGWNCSGIPHRI